MKSVIFDLDGTLANIDHRRHFVTNGNKDWKSFLHPYNVIQDLPNHNVIDLFHAVQPRYRMYIFTGRNESLRVVTMEWLIRQNISPYWLVLLMRKDGDYRPDHIVKEEMLLSIGLDDIAFVVDDRQQVVDMWRRNGITCLQCAPGDF